MAEKTIEMKLSCPMAFFVSPEDIHSECYEVSAQHFAEHADEINRLIIDSFGIYDPEQCGLAAYIIDDDLAEKIISIIPSVENINGELRGFITVASNGELTETEMGKLMKELTKQLDEGWGHYFSDLVTLGSEDAYISFLYEKDGEELRVIGDDEEINLNMGGLS